MDYVHIQGLRIVGKHGHYVHERRGAQEFEVSVRVALDTTKAGKSDKLHHSLSYSKIKEVVEKAFAAAPRYLLERLAEEIARALLKDARVKEVVVTIKKLKIWKNGIPGVTITRKR
ncbi:MAG: dihydroneopterin aldolase [Patescibacteria group bacterium]